MPRLDYLCSQFSVRPMGLNGTLRIKIYILITAWLIL